MKKLSLLISFLPLFWQGAFSQCQSDTQPPQINILNENFSVECCLCMGIGTELDIPGTVIIYSVTDNCDDFVTVERDTIWYGDCGNTGELVYRFTATDNFGNTSSDSLVIDIVDTTLPDWVSVPANQSFDCYLGVIPAATAEDKCAGVLSTSYEVLNDLLADTVLIQYFATDSCGNTRDTIVEFYRAALPYSANIPADTTVSFCDVASYDSIVIEGGCGIDSVIFLGTSLVGDSCGGYTYRHWEAYKDGFLVFADSQKISFVRDWVPEFIGALPIDTTLDCVDLIGFGTLTLYDQCLGIIEVLPTLSEVGDSCQQVITASWSHNVCDVVVSHDQAILVEDFESPVLIVPADTLIPCGSPITPVFIGEATATDNCSFSLEFTDDFISGPCGEVIRTWTATDPCGNSATGVQRIILFEDAALDTCKLELVSNPVNDQLVFRLITPQGSYILDDCLVTIYNIYGKVVLEQDVGGGVTPLERSIDISSLESGTYVLRVVCNSPSGELRVRKLGLLFQKL